MRLFAFAIVISLNLAGAALGETAATPWEDRAETLMRGNGLLNELPSKGNTMLLDTTPTSIVIPKSGVKAPLVLTKDYQRGFCDAAHLIGFMNGMRAVQVMYDDGELKLDCWIKTDAPIDPWETPR